MTEDDTPKNGTDRYALVDSNGRIPFHNGYEDVRVAYREAQRVGQNHPRESPETVNVIKISGSQSVTFHTVDTITEADCHV
jgi:hypothetical protein